MSLVVLLSSNGFVFFFKKLLKFEVELDFTVVHILNCGLYNERKMVNFTYALPTNYLLILFFFFTLILKIFVLAHPFECYQPHINDR